MEEYAVTVMFDGPTWQDSVHVNINGIYGTDADGTIAKQDVVDAVIPTIVAALEGIVSQVSGATNVVTVARRHYQTYEDIELDQ